MNYKTLQKIIAQITLLISSFACAGPAEYLDSIQTQPTKLYAFFKQMPKGGELHYHFTGSSYPEELITTSRQHDFYLNPKTFIVTPNKESGSTLTKQFFKHAKNRKNAAYAWSMQDFAGNYKARHDHFFEVFKKIYPIYNIEHTKLLANMLNRAANQNEIYMEIILSVLRDPERYSHTIAKHHSLSTKKSILLNNPSFISAVEQMVIDGNKYIQDTRKYLKCDKQSTNKACEIIIRTQSYVLREAEMDNFFTQALAAFLAATKSENIVGVNLVQPESGENAMQNFDKHMQVFNFLHTEYPNINISLHAGELDPKINKPSALTNHISQSIYIGKAQRIGHGTDIQYETDNKKLMQYMAKHNIPVEINLISNKLILSVTGDAQPLNYYLKHKVPVVLSTDDEGILQTDLTSQYVEAVVKHNLSYKTLKNINRNTLTYSFIPGKSIWENPQSAKLIKDCQVFNSKTCKAFAKNNLKAQLQLKLEKRLIEFEKAYY